MIIKVEMGEGAVSKPPDIIVSQGIGSCVVLTLYDAEKKIGGVAHIMFPTNPSNPPFLKGGKGGLFQSASTAVPALLDEMVKMGASKNDICAKIIGGARMVSSYADVGTDFKSVPIGEENITSIKQTLQKYNIPIAGFDVGGGHGRNVEFEIESGMVVVKAFGREDKEI